MDAVDVEPATEGAQGTTGFGYWGTRSKVLRFIRETWEGTNEFAFHHGPSQADVAFELFDGDFHQALAVLRDLERLGDARRVLSFGQYCWIPAEVPRTGRASNAHTEVTERILKYVTDEFNEGKAGNRDSLPSTRDIAQACVRGYGKDKSCRRALVHLNRLVGAGEIIMVQDPEDKRWHRTFWALPNSGLMAEENDAPVTVAMPFNRFGFTDEEWATLKPWQRNAIRMIEMAETTPPSW